MKIGMIGVGMMGHGIALNLARKGHELCILDHPGNQPLDQLAGMGATTVPSPAELAGRADMLILVVTGSAQVEAVLTGPDGILASLRPGSIVVDCSTSIPASTVRMAAAVREAGSEFLEAPMTRTPIEAEQGRLNLLVGGDPALLARCRPILACFAENITYIGPTGTAHSMKLLHNFVSLGMVALLAEAGACARRSGVDPQVFIETLKQGGGGGAALERMTPYLRHGDPGGLRFSLANARKDLGYYGTMAQDAQAHHRIADALSGVLDDALQQTDPNTCLPELLRILSEP